METPPPNSQARNISNVHTNNTRTEVSVSSNADHEEKLHKATENYQKI